VPRPGHHVALGGADLADEGDELVELLGREAHGAEELGVEAV